MVFIELETKICKEKYHQLPSYEAVPQDERTLQARRLEDMGI